MAKSFNMTKRVQLDKAKATMLGILVGASVITVFSLVASKSFFSQANYLRKVAGKKEKALDTLKKNKEAVGKLEAAFESFSGQNPNLIGGNSTGTGDKDGDNARLVLDALPSKYDFPALATSLEKLLQGYTINNISGSDDTSTQEQSENAELVEIPFEIGVESDYANTRAMVQKFEKSIRPFQIQTLTVTGSNAQLQTAISAKTFYQPEKDLKVSSEVVK